MKSKTFILENKTIKLNSIDAIRVLPEKPLFKVTISKVKSLRTLLQNAKMWAMLTDISKQVKWHGNQLTPENWKDMITAGLKNQIVVPGITGGFVALGEHTSKMSIEDMIDVIDFAYAFGQEKGVKWSEKSKMNDESIPLRFYENQPAGQPPA